LDKIEAAMKQTIANKQVVENDLKNISKSKSIMEKENQQLKEHYEQAKV